MYGQDREAPGGWPPEPGPPRRRRARGVRWLLAAALGAVAIGGAGWVVFGDEIRLLMFATERHEPESSARFVGDDAFLYTSINLRPGVSALRDAKSFFDRLRRSQPFDESYNEQLESLEDALGMSAIDALQAIGPELGLALYSREPGLLEPEWVALIGYRNRERAVRLLKASLVDDPELIDTVPRREFEGRESYTDEDTGAIFAFVDEIEYILGAESEESLSAAIRTALGPGRSLADAEWFIEAREDLPSGRLASFFLNLEPLSDEIRELYEDTGLDGSGFGLFGADPLEGTFDLEGEAVSDALTIAPRSARVDIVGPAQAAFAGAPDRAVRAVKLLPAESLGLLAFVLSWDEIAAEARSAWDDLVYSEDGMGDALTEMGFALDGLDFPMGDAIAAGFASELAFAVTDLRPSDEPTDSPFGDFPSVGLALMVKLGDMPGIDGEIDRLREWTVEQGVEFTRSSVGGRDAWIIGDSEAGDDEFLPQPAAYSIMDGYLVVASPFRVLAEIDQVLAGARPSLDTAGPYIQTTGMSAGADIAVLYANLEQIFATVPPVLSPDDRREFESEVLPWIEPLQAFSFSSEMDGDRARISWVLTLR